MAGGKSCAICKIAALLAGIGALNWGLVGIFQMDLVAKLLGEMTGAARAAYAVIGVGGLLTLLGLLKVCPCQRGSCESAK